MKTAKQERQVKGRKQASKWTYDLSTRYRYYTVVVEHRTHASRLGEELQCIRHAMRPAGISRLTHACSCRNTTRAARRPCVPLCSRDEKAMHAGVPDRVSVAPHKLADFATQFQTAK